MLLNTVLLMGPSNDSSPTYTSPKPGRLLRTPARVGGTNPTLGRDNEYVLKEILGYDDERIAQLVIAGALE